MKRNVTSVIRSLTVLLLLEIPVQLAAQQTRYKVIDVATLGGPNSSTGFEPSPLNALSSQGVFTACADTSAPDPNYPNFNPFIVPGVYGLPLPDPVIIHAFQWKNGTLTDLGALHGANSSCSYHISGNGLIAGVSENGVIDPITGWPEVQAVLWKHGQVINLGNFAGNESFSNAVNNRGQVVGAATNTILDQFSIFGFGTQTRAFLWQNGRMRDLGTLGGPDAFAIYINDRGQVLGASYTNSTPEPTTGVPTFDGFLWENGKMTDIPDPLGGTQLNPFYLSNKGQVVGSANLPGDNFEKGRHPFLWENGVFTDLGTFGGTVGDANKINDADQIVGDAGFADATYHATIWQNGMKSDLGTVRGDPCSFGFDINSRGQAVGWSGVCEGPGLDRAFLWEKDGPMVDLNTLISSDSGIYVFIATNINDRGEIAGSGVLPNGDIRAVLLIPCGDGREGCGTDVASATTTTRDNSSLTPAQRLAIRRTMARSRTRPSRIPGLDVPKD